MDVRSPEEFRGEKLHMPEYPQEGAVRGGHIPGAKSMPWARAVNPDTGEFRSADELKELYEGQLGLEPDEETIAYCRIGERSSHSWFALSYLLVWPTCATPRFVAEWGTPSSSPSAPVALTDAGIAIVGPGGAGKARSPGGWRAPVLPVFHLARSTGPRLGGDAADSWANVPRWRRRAVDHRRHYWDYGDPLRRRGHIFFSTSPPHLPLRGLRATPTAAASAPTLRGVPRAHHPAVRPLI